MSWMRNNNSSWQKLWTSFWHALCGIYTALREERNMRIHCSAVILVSELALMYGCTAMEWLILLLIFALVVALELVNTAIEAVVDLHTKEQHPLAKKAKDVAAGAVLVAALFAVGIAVVLFSDGARWTALWQFFLQRPWLLGIGIIELSLLLWFVLYTPKYKDT